VADGTEIKRFDGHTDEVQVVAFSANGNSLYSGAKDATMRRWQVLSLTELEQWAQNNRFIPTLTCEQRVLYRVEPLCAADS
jgi:WD40 repeat protein